MVRRRGALARLLAALLLVGLAAPAAAETKAKDAKEGGPHLRYARSYAEAMAEAKDRGCVVFATFHEDGWKYCAEMHRSVLENADFVAWANENVVVLVGHPKGAHKSVDVAKPAKGEPRTQCSLYPGIACEDHEKAFVDATGKEPGAGKDDKKDDKAKKEAKAKAAAKKKDDGKPDLPRLEVSGFPASYMVAPDGTVLKHGADRQPGPCKDALVEFQRKYDENPVPFAKWQDVRKAMAEGEKAFKESKWKASLAAYARADAALGGKMPKTLFEPLKARLDAMDLKAAARLEEIRKGKGDDAAKARSAQALRAEFAQPFTAGPLAVVAQIDAFLAQVGAAPAR